jgi:NAD(P)-dependent dehydrogenase (short-subunit alcohol dehydrogenase family)
MTQVHQAGNVPVQLPLRRFVQSEEVADLVTFLLWPSGSITGQRLVICAGASL